MRQHRYTASFDRLSKWVTCAVAALLVYITVQTYLWSSREAVLPVVFCILICSAVFVFSPRAYEIRDNELIVHRLITRVRIPLSGIRSAECLEKGRLKGSIRTFGVGGFFGYWGRFRVPGLGATTWYLTRRDRVVLLQLQNGKKLLLSPDRDEAFLAELRNQTGIAP